eukprot:362172-Prorocentrum_minimum.AAC.2
MSSTRGSRPPLISQSSGSGPRSGSPPGVIIIPLLVNIRWSDGTSSSRPSSSSSPRRRSSRMLGEASARRGGGGGGGFRFPPARASSAASAPARPPSFFSCLARKSTAARAGPKLRALATGADVRGSPATGADGRGSPATGADGWGSPALPPPASTRIPPLGGAGEPTSLGVAEACRSRAP